MKFAQFAGAIAASGLLVSPVIAHAQMAGPYQLQSSASYVSLASSTAYNANCAQPGCVLPLEAAPAPAPVPAPRAVPVPAPAPVPVPAPVVEEASGGSFFGSIWPILLGAAVIGGAILLLDNGDDEPDSP